MNDATRELGAALGIAVLGSFAASEYSSSVRRFLGAIPASARSAARSSLASAIEAADKLSPAAKHTLLAGSKDAFIDGLHLAVTAGAVLCALASIVVYRYLPSQTPPISGHGDHGEMTAVDAAEVTAEMGFAGFEPVLDRG
jgi:hypothetical protein